PEKAWRWKAGTALRRLSDLNENSILTTLLREQNVETCLPFQDSKLTYFWISAKLYLWITAARISKENPQALLPLSKAILQELKDESLPHVLIYHFIRDVCMTLLKQRHSIFSANDVQFIEKRLSTISRRFKVKSAKTAKKKSSKLKFKF